MMGLRRLVPVAVAAALLPFESGAVASATAGVGISAQTLSTATVDGQDFVTREITIAPGGSTGWHWHPGRVFGVIRSGTLTHDVSDCSSDGVYPTGSPITEGSGPDDVHVGRNLGPDPVVMWVVYVNPTGDPLAVPVPNPGCPFE